MIAMVGARYALHQQGHLLFLARQAALQAVCQRLLAEGAGIHHPHRFEELLQAVFGRALIDAEEAVVLAGEGVAESVLQQAG